MFLKRYVFIAITIAGVFSLFSMDSSSQEPTPSRESWKFDFGSGPVEKDYIAVDNLIEYSAEQGFGWIIKPQMIRDRNEPTNLLRDFMFSREPATFRVDIPSGMYLLTLTMGDIMYGDHVLETTVNGTKLPVLSADVAEFVTLSTSIHIENDTVEFVFDSPTKNWALNVLTLENIEEEEDLKMTKKSFEQSHEVPDTWQDVFTWSDPVEPYVKRFRRDLEKNERFQTTGLNRKDYLDVIAGVVDFFKNYQDENGAIIDPYEDVEWQYSTPCYALAAARLIVSSKRNDLIESASRALDWSTLTLSQRKAASAHEDFFSPQLAHAMPLLKPYVSPERYAEWETHIRSFDPYKTYRSRIGGANWNVVALSGEGLFHSMELRSNTGFITDSLAAQGKFFSSPWGLYTEGPMPYDHFPRIWAADMLSHGYRDKFTNKLEEVLRRGALTSLFMQSPCGELPAGGRSAHHQWNEAEQCFTYELYAQKAKYSGDLVLAGVFKRGAHLSLQSIKRWVRPSGELWIVKNRVDPSMRHGYEGYSAHSQYNLLAMAMLAIAYEYAQETDAIPEQPAPADIGGFVMDIGAPFNKIFANAGGLYIEIDYFADLHYNPTGLLRIHKSGFNPQLGPSDGLSEKAVSNYPESPGTTAAIGVEWVDTEGTPRRLAEYGRGAEGATLEHNLTIIEQSPGSVEFALRYTGNFSGPDSIIEHYKVTPDYVDFSVELEGYEGPVRFVIPVLSNDGEKDTAIEIKDTTISVGLNGDTQTYQATKASKIWVSDERYPFRNGWATLTCAEYPQNEKITLHIQPTKGGER